MIKIEVTGNSIAEVSDKLLAIGASLQGRVVVNHVGADEVKPTVGTEAAKRTRKQKVAEETIPVANGGTGADTEVAEYENPTDATGPQPSGSTEAGEQSAGQTPSDAPKKLDFDKEVAPLVLQLVKTKGPEAIKRILDQFGVERASQIEPARYGELVDLVNEAL